MRSDGSDADGWSRPPGRTPRRRVLGGIGVAALVALGGCSGFAEANRRTATEQFSVAGTSVDRLVVRGGDGDTTVRGWDGSDVRVEATKYALGETNLGAVTVTREVVGRRLAIGAEVSDIFRFGASGGGLDALAVRVPDGVRVEEVAVDDGTARVNDVSGDLALSVDDGDARADEGDGDVDVNADDGAVTVGRVGRVAGAVDDGSLRMTDGSTVGDVTADDGSVELAVRDIDGDATVRSDDGDVEAALSPALDATVEVSTDDGSVRVEDGVFDSVETSAGTVRGTIGNGGDRPTVILSDVTI